MQQKFKIFKLTNISSSFCFLLLPFMSEIKHQYISTKYTCCILDTLTALFIYKNKRILWWKSLRQSPCVDFIHSLQCISRGVIKCVGPWKYSSQTWIKLNWKLKKRSSDPSQSWREFFLKCKCLCFNQQQLHPE